MSLKLLINSQNNSVLFAEASKDFVDFLFHLLSLPIATVINLLQEQGMPGCIANLYKSIDTVNVTTYIQSGQSEGSFLEIIGLPSVLRSGPVPLMILDDPNEKYLFYKCNSCSYRGYSNDPREPCPGCWQNMATGLKYVAPIDAEKLSEGGSVKGMVTYMVMDDLVVKQLNPMSTISSLALMNKFNLKDISVLREKEVHIGKKEVSTLLIC